MTEFIVTYTSMIIEADSEEEAVDYAGEFKGGGNWEAVRVETFGDISDERQWEWDREIEICRDFIALKGLDAELVEYARKEADAEWAENPCHHDEADEYGDEAAGTQRWQCRRCHAWFNADDIKAGRA